MAWLAMAARLGMCWLGLGALLGSSWAFPATEKVATLPGLNFKPNFDHYSGFLNADTNHTFHYQFVTSQSGNLNDPVILWLNGGPGCSSLGGMFEELGPFFLSDDAQTVYENIYAWNKLGHVLFIESPAGVGFSYATDGNINTDDDQTAKDNHLALKSFFNKFPEIKGNDFYITGESYAGIYLPTLAVRLVNDPDFKPRFKGMAVGNGYMSPPLLNNALVGFLYSHGLVEDSIWNHLSANCCNKTETCDYNCFLGNHTVSTCGFDINTFFICQTLVIQALNSNQDNLNPYNLMDSCYLNSNTLTSRKTLYARFYKQRRSLHVDAVKGLKDQQSSPRFSNLPLCDQGNTEPYLNRADVREALHIPSNLSYWTDCNFVLNGIYKMIYTDMYQQFVTIMGAGVRILVFNGDTDTVCNAIGDEWFVKSFKKPIIQNFLPWTYNNELPSTAGYAIRYQGVDFLTVRGSGHFVPETRPREALQMIANFIRGRDYSTPTGLDMTPQPLIARDPCHSPALNPNFFGGPVPASYLCNQGTCVSPDGVTTKCQCYSGFTGEFCSEVVPDKAAVFPVCAVYATPSSQANGIPAGCQPGFHCMPYQVSCLFSTCEYPVGSCLPVPPL